MKRINGFTLIELAVVIFIITLLAGSLLVPLSAQVDQRKIAETQKSLDDIREALIGYAVVNKQLPCPAVSATNGLESAHTGLNNTCASRDGFIPWVTLGVNKLDAWGRIFHYSVSARFSAPFALTTTGDITIKTRNATGAFVNLTNLNDVVAVVLSYGKNGYYGVNDQGVQQALPAAAYQVNGNDEYANSLTGIPPGSPKTFISRTYTNFNPACNEMGGGAKLCEFDDILVWLPPYVLFNRMIQAGQLP